MPRDINSRLSNLNTRRKGLDAYARGRVTAEYAEALNRSVLTEGYERRASAQPHTRYALGAMQAVDNAYTQKSRDEAERVGKQLREGLAQSVTTRLQGSVPLDVHIRGVSDVDLLCLTTDHMTYYHAGSMALNGAYAGTHTARTSVEALAALRADAEKLLKLRFPAVKVDCSGGKCIALSGGSLARPVDVVPSHWVDTIVYQASRQEHDRGVKILDKKVPVALDNLPFTHIKRVHDRDALYWSGLKKAIRLVKNVKNDAENETSAEKLPSFDIAALLYHADAAALKAGIYSELSILMEARRFLDWCWANRSQAGQLRTPDESRIILNTEAKWEGVLTISCELDQLARQVAAEQNRYLSGTAPWPDVYKSLEAARVPAAA